MHEYSRLANNYYKNPNLPFSPYSFFNNEAINIYAKYFLYKEWLENQLIINKPTSISKPLYKIDKKLIDKIRTNLGTIGWTFDNSDNKINTISKELTHTYLLGNFNIDDEVLKYYCRPNIKLLSEEEYKKMIDSGYVGKKETVLYPYSVIILGAYYSRNDLTTKLTGLKIGDNYKKINGKSTEYLSDLLPYFKEYSNGFKIGFNGFDDTQIKPFLTMFSEKKDYIDKVFDYLTSKLFFRENWGISIELGV